MKIIDTDIKVVAYYILHYGSEYLEASIKSIDSYVDSIVILYSDKPTQGFGTGLVCPDTEEQLLKIALSASNKINWQKINAGNEGEHRGMAYKFSEGADVLLAVDADEVWDVETLEQCIYKAYHGTTRYYGISGYLNFWKSFSWVCTDGYTPIRLTNLHKVESDGMSVVFGIIYHFSLAQRLETVIYKWEVGGHKDELRPAWFERYKNWQPGVGDLHPVAICIWNAIEFDKEKMPKILKDHENFSKDIIN